MPTPSYPLALALAAALLAPAVQAQSPAAVATPSAPSAPSTGAVAAADPAQPPQAVVISGSKRTPTGESLPVFAAKRRMLRGSLAEKCQLDTPYASAEDDMANYLEKLAEGPVAGELGENVTPLNDPLRQKFSANAPTGDASNMVESSSITGAASTYATGPCGVADRRFASGRGQILLKDKSFAEGLAAVENKEYATAIERFKVAYNKIGYPEAGVYLGKLYLNGLGAPRDVELGKEWLNKVIAQRFNPQRDRLPFDLKDPEAVDGRIEAALLMAKMAMTGAGLKQDPAEGRRWLAKAAEFGYIPALNALGLAAQDGYGGARDIAKARAYFQEAAEAGYLPAQFNLGKIYYLGLQGTPQDFKLAGAWFAAAAKQGHPGALFAVGRMYDVGESVPVDQQRAIAYYKEAALKSDASAQNALATYFYTGEQVPQNLATARKLFNAAAVQGNAEAMFNLAVMSAHGEGGDKDLAMAFVWFSLAKASGHANAGTALDAIAPTLSAEDKRKAEAILAPRAQS